MRGVATAATKEIKYVLAETKTGTTRFDQLCNTTSATKNSIDAAHTKDRTELEELLTLRNLHLSMT